MGKCKATGCTKRASYGLGKGQKPSSCSSHKTVEMVNLLERRKCSHEGCEVRPRYGIPQEGKATRCSQHKTEGMSNVSDKRFCQHEGCSFRPRFGYKDGKSMYCGKHKLTDMVDKTHKVCEQEGCKLLASFGIKGGKIRFCSLHKTSEMVDISHKVCESLGCDSRPIYGFKNGKARFCTVHKEKKMINVSDRLCEKEGCDLRPIFGVKGEKARFCGFHKESGMIDVYHKRCEKEDCDLRPHYGVRGKEGKFCAKHKQPGMIDVSHRRCKHEGCETRVLYGKPGLQRTHCFQHREKGMIRRPNAKCRSKGCKELAVWGVNWVPRHCEDHKVEDDENLVERPCSKCGLDSVLDAEGYCETCHPETWARVRLAKQNGLMNYLDARGLKGDSTDRIVDGGVCGMDRPDRVYDFGDKIVVLECDENQHDNRPCLCEQTRMINIGQSFGGLPVYFIRWNPDDYSPEDEKKNPEVLSKRYKLCGDLISDIQENRITLPNALVSAVYLYYDGWSSLSEESWQTLMAMENITNKE
jgi:hypothetical protein